ncbi:hypothetical protein DY000_02025046 [Brassica cretica]|uniref:BED-type domain-containing protein n=1 Tax=Brassica cretica TaxID=69181 RepID=A0ABQ7EHN1_BRACR|nr:hypothetical protein DY000_02025046 [Brassica cretica]
MSACEDNGDFLAEDVEADIDPGGGKKRSASERSSTDMPPIAKKNNCRYCAQGIGCDSKKSGTSAMKNHIARCKMYQLYKESGKQQMSACEDNGDFLAEDVEADIDPGGGKKRSASERSSTDMPPIAKKNNCRYCAQGIGCDSKKSGTSAMKNHIARCKMYQLYKESGKQQSLCKFRVNLIIRGWNVEEVKTNLAYHSLLDNLSF